MKDWKPPEVHIADSVLWYDHADTGSGGYAAIVSGVSSSGQVDLKLQRNSQHDELRMDVLHVGDPRLKKNDHLKEMGGWDFSHLTRRIQRMSDLMDEMISTQGRRTK
jgi:hypothetical protein